MIFQRNLRARRAICVKIIMADNVYSLDRFPNSD